MAFFSDLLKKWFYTNSSSAASSDARIPLLTATGEPKGSDTMANIASVLGGQIQTLENYDINNLYSEGGKGNSLYKLVYCTNTPSGLNYCMLHVFYDGGDCYQMAFSPIYSATEYAFIRRRGNGQQWTDWSTISLNIPSFYKNYANIGELSQGTFGYDSTLNSGDNLNGVLTSGIYYIDSLPSNAPSGLINPVRSFMVVHSKTVSSTTTYTTQIIHSVVGSTNRMWVRNYDMPDWSDWKEVSFDVPTFYKDYQDIVSLTSGVKRAMKVSQKTLVVPANGSNSELGLQANPFTVIKADTSNFNGCIVLLCDHAGFMVLGNYGGFNDWVTLSASGGSLVIQNKTGVQLTLPVFTFVG